MNDRIDMLVNGMTSSEMRRAGAQPEYLMNVSLSERLSVAVQCAISASDALRLQLCDRRTTAATAFTLAAARLREAQQSLEVTCEEKSRKVNSYKALSPRTHVQSTILSSLLLMFSALPDRAVGDHALDALTHIDWSATDANSCATLYNALSEHVSVSKLSEQAARAVVQTKLFSAVRSGSLYLLTTFLASGEAQHVQFPEGIPFTRVSPYMKPARVTLTTDDLPLRVGPALFSSSRNQKMCVFPLDTVLALVAKSRLLLLDTSASTPSVYSLKSQAPFPTLHADEHPIYMNEDITLTVRGASRRLYEQRFTLHVYRQRKQDADAVVHIMVNTRASLVSNPVCLFAYNGRLLSCLFFSACSGSITRSPLFVLDTQFSVDALPRESHLTFGNPAAALQRLSAVCAPPSAGTPYLSLSFTKGYTLTVGDVTILDHFQPFCVEMWVFLRHVEEPQRLITIGDKSADEVFIEVEPAQDGVTWRGGSRSTFLGASFAAHTSSGAHTVANRWTHVALNFTGTQWELSLDHCVEVRGEAIVRPDPITSARCRLGGSLSGFLAEVRVWQCRRTLLELQRDAFRGLHGDEPFLCGYYPLNEGGGDVVADYSVKGAHALLATSGGGHAQMSSWSTVPPPPVSFANASPDNDDDDDGARAEPRRISDIVPLAVAESSEDVLFATTASSFFVTCHKNDTVHVYQYDMDSLLLTLEYAITVPKTWVLLDVRGDVKHNTLMCCAAVVGARTSLIFWELQSQGPPLLGTLRRRGAQSTAARHSPQTAWQVGCAVFQRLAYYAERLVPLEVAPRYPIGHAMVSMTAAPVGASPASSVPSSSTPWPPLLVSREEEVVPQLFRLALMAATASGDASTDKENATIARDICSVLSVNLLLRHESASEVSQGQRDTPDGPALSPLPSAFATVEEMLDVMGTGNEALSSALLMSPDCALNLPSTQLRDNLVRLALQPFARDTSLLQTCCRCFLSSEGTLAFIKKLSGKPRNSREETVLACLVDSFATLPAAQDLLKSITDGQVVFDALILDTLAIAQSETTKPKEGFLKGIHCLTVLLEVILARCATFVSPCETAKAPEASSRTAPPIDPKSTPAIVVLAEHCAKSLLKASRHLLEWGAKCVRQDVDTAPRVLRQLRKSHVGTLLPWLLLTLPSMPTHLARACLPIVRGCREALRSVTESFRHSHFREVGKARWLSELQLILLHSEGVTASLLTVEGLRHAPSPSPATAIVGTTSAATGASDDDGATSPGDPDVALNTQRLMPLLMGGLRKTGTERDLLVKNLEHGVGPISKIVEELQRSDVSALRVMRDEGTRKMELQIMAAFCALCVPTADLANATKATLQPPYRHVVALRPWILAKRQESKSFIQEVTNRARFLAMFEPCYYSNSANAAAAASSFTSRSPSTTGTTITASRAPSGPTSGTPTGPGKHSTSANVETHAIDATRRRWRKLFQTWRATKLMATRQCTQSDGDSTRLFGDIKDVLRSNATPDQLEQIVSARVRLAHQRLRGLLALVELVEEARADTLTAATLLPLMAQHLCQWHYARDVECCSTEDHFRLQEAFFQLLNAVVDGFNDASTNTNTSYREPWEMIFASFLTCPFRADDLRCLRGVAFATALHTLCSRLISDPLKTKQSTPNVVEPASVAAFSRPFSISIGVSGIPLLVSGPEGFGTAVGPYSCCADPTSAATSTSRLRPSSSSCSSCTSSYFEVYLADVGTRGGGSCAIGLGPPDYSVCSFPGFDPGSCALRLHDGLLFTGNKATGKPTGCTFVVGDVAGCGVSRDKKSAFWTRNGIIVATVPLEDGELSLSLCHPLIGLEGSVKVMVNLGHDTFVAPAEVLEEVAPEASLGVSSRRHCGHGGRLVSSNDKWHAFRAFSLQCALSLARQNRAEGTPRTASKSSVALASHVLSPPSPTVSRAPLDHLMSVMGLCFSQLGELIASLHTRLFPLCSSPSVRAASDNASGGAATAMSCDEVMRNMLTALQHTQTVALLLAEVDAAAVASLAPFVQPLTATLHQLMRDLLSTPRNIRSATGRGGESGNAAHGDAMHALNGVPTAAAASIVAGTPHDNHLMNAVMLTYYFTTHLTPPQSSTTTATHGALSATTAIAGSGGEMLTLLLQLAGRVCIASRELGDLGAPPSPPGHSQGAAESGAATSENRVTSNAAITEAAEQAVWMAVTLLQRMIASPSPARPTHAWQPVLLDWLRTRLDRPKASGRDVVLALTILESGPRLAVPGDTVSVYRSPLHETRGVLKWISIQDDVCQILNEEGRPCYLPLSVVDVIKQDGPQSDFPQPACTVHVSLAQQVVTLCRRLWPTPERVVAVSLEQQAIYTAALSLLSRCVARRVVMLPTDTVRAVLSLACMADSKELDAPQRCDAVQLRFQKVLTESWCAALLQTNQMRRRPTSVSGLAPLQSPVLAQPPLLAATQVTSSTTEIYRTVDTSPYIPTALRSSATSGAPRPWDADFPMVHESRAPRRFRGSPPRARHRFRYGDGAESGDRHRNDGGVLNSDTDDEEEAFEEEDVMDESDESNGVYDGEPHIPMSGTRDSFSDRDDALAGIDHVRQQQRARRTEEEAFAPPSLSRLGAPHSLSASSSSWSATDGAYDAPGTPDDLFFLDEYELLAPELAPSRGSQFFVNQRETEVERLLQQWMGEDDQDTSRQGPLGDEPHTWTTAMGGAPVSGVTSAQANAPSLQGSTGIHFDHSCLRLFANRDLGQYYTVDLHVRLRHLRGHQIIFVQQTSLSRTPAAEIIARIHRGALEFGWIESLPGEEATARVVDVCRYTLRPEDVVGRWVRLTFAQVGTVVSIFRDGALRSSHRMRPNVSSLLQEEFILGGVPEDPTSSLEGSLRDVCIYDVALRPAVIDQLTRHPSPLANFVESHLAVRLQVRNMAFVNAARPPAAVLLDIAAHGEVGNMEQRRDSSDTAADQETTLNNEHTRGSPSAAVPPVEEADFSNGSEYQDQWQRGGMPFAGSTRAWRQHKHNSLDRLTADYSECLRQLMLQYGTRLTMEILVHALSVRESGAAIAPTAQRSGAAVALAELSKATGAVHPLVQRILLSTDRALHAILATAVERVFTWSASAATQLSAGSDEDVSDTATALGRVATALVKSLLSTACVPEKRAAFESAHPIRSVISTHLELLPGDGEKEMEDFHIFFDPRCASSQGTYTFSANPTMTELFYAARSYAISDFRVTLPRLFMDIRADVNSAPQWGFKLAVVWRSEPQLQAMRLLRAHVRTPVVAAVECLGLLETCARVNSGKSRRLALACLTELLVISPPSPFPPTLLSSLHSLHLMAERLSRTVKPNSRSLHRTRFSQVAMECYLFYRDTYLCSATSESSARETAAMAAAHGTRAEAAALEWKALSPQEEQEAYQAQRQQRRLLYEARKEERVDLVTLDVSRSVSLEWTAHHTCVARSENGSNSLVTNIALGRGRWYYEVKMGGTGSVFLGVYAVPQPSDGAHHTQPRPKRYALNGHTGVVERPRDPHNDAGRTTFASTPPRNSASGGDEHETIVASPRVWGGKDTVGVIVDIPERHCRFLVNGIDTGHTLSFATDAGAAVTAATAAVTTNASVTAAPTFRPPSEPATMSGTRDGYAHSGAGDRADETDDTTFRLYFALDHGESASINFGGGAFDYAMPRHCMPVDPTHLGEESTLPYHQMRGFQDVALHFLEPPGTYPMPPFYHDVSEPFANCVERQGPAHVTLHAPEAVQMHGLDAKNTGPAFHTVHADCTVRGGRWYYEVTVRTQGLMQIGWAIHQPHSATPLPTGEDGCGVGDTHASWGVDGFRLVKWHAGKAEALSCTRRWTIGDVVGCALDLVRGTMLFTLNGRPLVGQATSTTVGSDGSAAKSTPSPAPFTFEQLPLSESPLYVPCVSLRAGNGVLFNFGSSAFRYKPDGFNALGVPDTWIERIETFYANERLASIQRRLEAIRRFCIGTAETESPRMESLAPYVPLVRFVDQLCASTGKTYRQLSEKILKDAVEEDMRTRQGNSEFAGTTPEDAWRIMEKLLGLTRILKSVFPFLAFGMGGANVTSRLFMALRPVLFRTWRLSVADALLRESNVRTEYVRLSVNRVMARSSAAAAETGRAAFERSILGQTFLSVAGQHPRLFRTNKRLWRTVLIGEGAEDVGGPYREHLTEMCAELMSSRLPFFVPSPNHQQNIGTHRDAFVPAAGAASTLALDVFVFVGRLMGSAVRSGEPLSLTFPPLVWKSLCGMTPCEADLHNIDVTCWQCVKEFRGLASQASIEQDAIDDVLDSTFFATQLCDGTTRDLIPGGTAIPVTAARLNEYVEALLRTRLHEFDTAVAKMREGLLSVVPDDVLVLLTPAELELKVCGQPDVSVEELRKGVVYEGLTSEDRRVALLWQALEEATPKQRRLFLRFASGRDRLPVKLRIVALPTTGDPDHSLVKAATCFFAVELPDYSSLDIMKRKLFYSIENCVDMDTDFVARPTNGEERPQLFTTFDTDRPDEFGASLSESNLSAP